MFQVCFGDVPTSQKAEVQHLLKLIQKTTCILERNGDLHKGSEVYSHVMKKYDYFREDIHSTEDFIRLSATKSTFSGMYYKVSCDEKTWIKTGDWLLKELHIFRNTNR